MSARVVFCFVLFIRRAHVGAPWSGILSPFIVQSVPAAMRLSVASTLIVMQIEPEFTYYPKLIFIVLSLDGCL